MAKRAPKKLEEGSIYLLNQSGTWYKAPKIDVDKVMKYRENIYLKGALDKLQRILFGEKYKIVVDSPDKENATPKELQFCGEVATQIQKMCDKKDVRLWYNMQRGWRDVCEWGPALFNPVWDYDGPEYKLMKLRRLAPETFNTTSCVASPTFNVRNRILSGITLDRDGETIAFYQKQRTGMAKKLENVFMLTDPISGEIGGEPMVLPVYYILPMMNFGWQKVMQQANRLGAGGHFFIKVTSPQGDDQEFAQKILKNINSNVAYQIRDNMEIINVPITEHAAAVNVIDALSKVIQDYFSPSSTIAKDGMMIGGSSEFEFNLYASYIEGIHSWLSDSFGLLLQEYLDANAYDDYSVRIEIFGSKMVRTAFFLQVATTGFQIRALDVNERRALLARAGAEIKPLNDEDITKMAKEYETTTAPAQTPLAMKAKMAIDAVKADPLDPYALANKKKARRAVNNFLGTEEGETND